MELPVGNPIKENMETSRIDFSKLFPTLHEHALTGYMDLSFISSNGAECGTLLYNEGEIIAAEYDYLASGTTIKGKDALSRCINACVGVGAFSICDLSSEELMSARESDRESVLKYKPSIPELTQMLSEEFREIPPTNKKSQMTAVTGPGGKAQISRDAVLKKYGISHPDDKMLDSLISTINS